MFKLWSFILALSLCLVGCLRIAESPGESERSVNASGGAVTRLLILGRDRAANLTDSILIAAINEQNGDLRILQIPRDTYAEYTDRDYKKLNGAYSTLGLKETKQFLSDALGVRLDYAVSFDLDCVAELVDAVGGVEVEVTQTMQYRDPYQNLVIDLQPGVHRLNGESAEHFLRFRSGYANADLGRMDAQKRFISAFVKQCAQMNATSLTRLIWTLFPHVETDLPIHRAVGLARLLSDYKVDQIPMLTAPGAAVQGVSGAWYYSLNKAGLVRVMREYLLSDVTEADFDPKGLFDRSENSDFHHIYIAPDVG